MRCTMFAAVIAAVLIGGCGPSPETGRENDTTLATINDYHLSLDTFQRQLASELELEPDYKLTIDAKREFLDSLIRKELLIQEAVRQELDRQPAFTKAIEKYWESTLIRDLIDKKGREISKRITVTEAEIADRYKALKESAPETGPLSEALRRQLIAELMAAKKTARLDAWMDELRRQATVTIDAKALARP